MYCGPHHRSSGNRLASRKLTIVRRVGDQLSTGPIGVLDQSNVPISAPISPPPARNAGGSTTDGFDMRDAPPSRVTPPPPIICLPSCRSSARQPQHSALCGVRCGGGSPPQSKIRRVLAEFAPRAAAQRPFPPHPARGPLGTHRYCRGDRIL